TPAAIFVVVLSSGPYMATVPMGYCGCCRPAPTPRSSSPPLPQQQCLYFLPLPQGQGALRESFLRDISLLLAARSTAVSRCFTAQSGTALPWKEKTPSIMEPGADRGRVRRAGAPAGAGEPGADRGRVHRAWAFAGAGEPALGQTRATTMP